MDPLITILIAMIVTLVGAVIKYYSDRDIAPLVGFFTFMSFFIPAMIAIFSYINSSTHSMDISMNFIDSFMKIFLDWFPGFILGDVGATLAFAILERFGISH
jgi:hypothetical protein